MSVIGIDFGNESCFVAAGKAGGIETLANDYSLRATPSCVAFAGKKRILGVAAKNQMVTNMKNTISDFKRLLGRKFNDPQVQNELKYIPYRVEQRPDGGVGIRVNYLDEDHVFSPEQITAMLFTKLKETCETELQAQVNDCVIAVPVFFTNAERMALLDAAAIAGFNVLRLFNETTAVALSYGFYKQDLPAIEDKPRNVIFVDFGNASLQCSAVAFNKGKLKMLCSAWDQIGGRDFDNILAGKFAQDFQQKYKINAKTNPRAWLRLLAEVEKIKKQMSANSTKLPLNIECFMEEIDVHSSMARSEMEELCADLLKRTEHTFRKCLQDSKLSPDDIYAVEVVGGSTRIPAVKALVEQIFNKTVFTTLNLDEAVSRGCALQCAILSPAVRARDFSVTDIQNYAVNVSWDGEGGQIGQMEAFSQFHAAPFSRMLTLFRREPFNMQIVYADPNVFPDPIIGRWHVKDVKPNPNGESQEVKIKVRINNNGIVLISNATMVDKKAEEEAEAAAAAAAAAAQPQTGGDGATNTEPMEQEDDFRDALSGDEIFDDDQHQYHYNHHQQQESSVPPKSPSSSSSAAAASAGAGPGWAQRVKGWFSSSAPSSNDDTNKTKDKKKKSSAKMIELPMEAKLHGYSLAELEGYQDQEWKMIKNDKDEKERVDAKNALEEFIYDMRDKLSEDGPLAGYIIEKDRESICSQLNELETWLYEDGEDCEREMYKQKLTNLHKLTDPIKVRSYEREVQPNEFKALGHSVQMAMKAVAEYRSGSQKYDHLTETEILNVSESAEKAQKWHDEQIGIFQKLDKTIDLPVKQSDIRLQNQTLTACMNSVLNRAKPKPPTPPATTTTTSSDKATDKSASDKDDTTTPPNNAEPSLSDPMDVE